MIACISRQQPAMTILGWRCRPEFRSIVASMAGHKVIVVTDWQQVSDGNFLKAGIG